MQAIEVDWDGNYVSDRRRVRGAGKARPWNNEEIRFVVAARQFSCTYRGAGAICAYCNAPISSSTFNLGFDEYNEGKTVYPAELDHITPKAITGEDDIRNYQYLCQYCNGQKLDVVTFHVVWQEERLGNTIEGASGFWGWYDVFTDVWNREKRMMAPLPYWMIRNDQPVFFGLNPVKRTIDREESFAQERNVLAENVKSLLGFYKTLNMPKHRLKLEGVIEKYSLFS